MNKMRLFFWVLMGSVALGQEKMPEIFPPPPEASSLGKFVEVPVSYYTGIPTIQVPIFDLDLDGMEIPISLRSLIESSFNRPDF